MISLVLLHLVPLPLYATQRRQAALKSGIKSEKQDDEPSEFNCY
jgi:hypothetical protein